MLCGCAIFDNIGNNTNNSSLPQIDNSRDLNAFVPDESDENEYEQGEQYYTSTSVDLVTEIHGNYSVNRPFTLDENDANKRIYHNIYFYVDDYFQIIYYKNVNILGEIYAILSDENDEEYAEVQLTERRRPLQINIIKEGVYNLVFDTITFGIDMIKIADIETPVYEKIKSCNLYIHTSATSTNYFEMTLDSETNEYFIQTEIQLNSSIGFVSASHISHYKMTMDENYKDRYIYWDSNSPSKVYIHIGGIYKIFFHAKTYTLRLELINPDTATYYCSVGFHGEELSPKSENEPYLFEYQFTAIAEPNETTIRLPKFFPELGMQYNLTITGNDGINRYGYVYAGTYKLTINLKTFGLNVEKIVS